MPSTSRPLMLRRDPIGEATNMRRFYYLLFTWGAIVYGAGFCVCLIGSWYWAGRFDISHLAIATGWPGILVLVVIGALLRLRGW